MPSAVLDLDLADLPEEIVSQERFSSALALIRLQGMPVGRAWLKLADGRIAGVELRAQLLEAAGMPLWEEWLRCFLDPSPPLPAPPCTIAIPTRDRPDDLRRCLAALAALPDDGQEILVVDNAPRSDATRQVVADYPHVRYVCEQRAGVNCARNRAVREAHNPIVAFTDDDAVVDPGWLRAITRHFRDDPLLLCVTGLTMPLELESDGQEGFENYASFVRGFQRRSFDCSRISALEAYQIGASVNMAIQRHAFNVVGPFNEAIGPGTATRTGSETEFFSRIIAGGYRAMYDPAALVWHRHRRTWQEARSAIEGYAHGTYAFLTQELLQHHDLDTLGMVWNWFRYVQLPDLIAGLSGRPSLLPYRLRLGELRGLLTGPPSYLRARRRLREEAGR